MCIVLETLARKYRLDFWTSPCAWRYGLDGIEIWRVSTLKYRSIDFHVGFPYQANRWISGIYEGLEVMESSGTCRVYSMVRNEIPGERMCYASCTVRRHGDCQNILDKFFCMIARIRLSGIPSHVSSPSAVTYPPTNTTLRHRPVATTRIQPPDISQIFTSQPIPFASRQAPCPRLLIITFRWVP